MAQETLTLKLTRSDGTVLLEDSIEISTQETIDVAVSGNGGSA